jgi:hypothetical protein
MLTPATGRVFFRPHFAVRVKRIELDKRHRRRRVITSLRCIGAVAGDALLDVAERRPND